MDPMDPDRAYQNGAFIPGSAALPGIWAQEAAALRAHARWEDIPYGTGERQGLDLFWPEGEARGLMVFVHGGYWLAFGRRDWSGFAAGALARGWAVAMPSYGLAPEVRIGAMVREVAQAVRVARERVAGPVVVTGHSAGGHLAARMGCADLGLGVARVVPISPLSELEPLRATGMQAELQLSEAEVAGESPARLPLACDAHVWVGGQERPAFLWQARTLSEAWGCGWTVDPGRHHFDVIDGLKDPGSGLVQACLGGL